MPVRGVKYLHTPILCGAVGEGGRSEGSGTRLPLGRVARLVEDGNDDNSRTAHSVVNGVWESMRGHHPDIAGSDRITVWVGQDLLQNGLHFGLKLCA
jgi:hypothetical protein